MRLALALMLIANAAYAGDLCAPGAVHHGAPASPAKAGRAAAPKAARRLIDLDLDRAQVKAALRLVADAAHMNLVVADDVAGIVTLHLKAVPWDAAACAIAEVAHVAIEVRDNILIATRAAGSR
jgi:type II secretory pathway component HofQ